MRSAFERLVPRTRRARRVTLVLAVVFALLAAAFGSSAADKLTAGVAAFQGPNSESAKVRDQVFAARGIDPDSVIVALVRPGAPVRSRHGIAIDRAVAARMAADPSISEVVSFAGTHDPTLVSRDGRSTYVMAAVGSLARTEAKAAAERLRSSFAGDPRVTLGGNPIADVEFTEQISKDLRDAELLVMPLLLLLLVLIFRGIVAALLPMAIAVLAILGANVGLRIAGEQTTVSSYALNLVVGLGLGLAIDYSLLMVSRYREELEHHGPGVEALRQTMSSAGRTVFFSALTVGGVLASLLVFPEPFLYSMGIAGVLVALTAGGAALLVLPALLGALGPKVNALSPRRVRSAADLPEAQASPFWGRLSRAVMRHPATVALLSAAFLLALASSALRAEFTFGDPGALPNSASARQVFEDLGSEYAVDRTLPFLVTAETSTPGRDAMALRRDLRAQSDVAYVGPVVASPSEPHLLIAEVVPASPAISTASEDLLERVRAIHAPGPVSVGGYTAAFADLKSSIVENLPLALALVALAMFVFIFGLTRSVVLPIKTLLLNLLTIGATLGVLVLVFQDGRFEGLLGYTGQGAVGTAEPVVLMILAFAISTDYAVFLLARITEEHNRGASDVDAVAWGLERTGRIVTAAALLFALALGALVLSGNVYVKQLGIGAAVAVLLDATIVRGLLVPSLMAMLGRWNWWAPAVLRRLVTAQPSPAVALPLARQANQDETEA
jgi:uncharacterized membrane protein YdfJ with MMPL/SSD domain